LLVLRRALGSRVRRTSRHDNYYILEFLVLRFLDMPGEYVGSGWAQREEAGLSRLIVCRSELEVRGSWPRRCV
jgi:nitrate reductase gamma subunit